MSDEKILCPKCGQEMINNGNVDKIMYATFPPCWDNTYVCDTCKVKMKVFHSTEAKPKPDYSDYEEIK